MPPASSKRRPNSAPIGNRQSAIGNRTALAIAAHPDDIEFGMAGTMLLLKAAGWEVHYMTLADGSCGSIERGPAIIRRIRRRESERPAAILRTTYHPSLVPDLEILYQLPLIR